MRLSLLALGAIATTAATAQTNRTSAADMAYAAPVPIEQATWFSSTDFPPDVVRDSGLVGARLSIDREGKVYRCHVTATSGVQKLDKKTCLVFLARARFTPARDENQRAVFGSYNYFMAWANPEQAHNPNPIVAAEIIYWVDHLPSGTFSLFGLKYITDVDGRIAGCAPVKQDSPKVLAKAACDELTKTGAEPLTDLTGRKVRSVMNSQVLFTTDKKLPDNIPGSTFTVEP
jgi:hypothetical protein